MQNIFLGNFFLHVQRFTSKPRRKIRKKSKYKLCLNFKIQRFALVIWVKRISRYSFQKGLRPCSCARYKLRHDSRHLSEVGDSSIICDVILIAAKFGWKKGIMLAKHRALNEWHSCEIIDLKLYSILLEFTSSNAKVIYQNKPDD